MTQFIKYALQFSLYPCLSVKSKLACTGIIVSLLFFSVIGYSSGLNFDDPPVPSSQPTDLIFFNITSTSFSVAFTAASGAPSGYLAVRRTNSSRTFIPLNNVEYTVGQVMGDGSVIVFKGSNTSFNQTSLTPALYHFDIFSYNQEGNLISYLTTNPLGGTMPICSNPLITISTLSDQTMCLPPNGALQVSIAGGNDDYLIEWEDAIAPLGKTGPILENITAGTYRAVITEVLSGCQSAYDAVVSDFTQEPDLSISFQNINNCGAGDGELTATAFLSGDAQDSLNYTFSWYHFDFQTSTRGDLISGNNGFPTLLGLEPGYYLVEAVDKVSGCSNSNSLNNIIELEYLGAPIIDGIEDPTDNPFSYIKVLGCGFSDNPSELQVWFGNVKGTIQNSTNSFIEVQVPAQARLSSIEVINLTNRLSARSTKKFMPVFNGTQPFTNNFSTTSFSNPDDIYDLCSCDFDGDGRPDIVGSKFKDGMTNLVLLKNQSTVQANNSTLSFSQTSIPINAPTFSVTCGDLNGDGKPEIVASRGGNVTGNAVYIFPNTSSTGSVSFGSPITLDLVSEDFAKEVAVHDMNGDGRPEIIVTNGSTNFLYIFQNNLSTTTITKEEFARIDLSAGTATLALEIADVTGDGWPDIITSPSTSAQRIVILSNPGNGSFNFSSPFNINVSGSTNINDIASADFNNDGFIDIVIADRGSSKAFVLLNQHNLIFSSVNSSTGFASPTAWGVDVGDMNGDGFADFVIGSRDFVNPQVNIFISNGAATPLFTATRIVTPKANWFVRVGDFDGDAKPDIAVTATNNSTSFSIDILRNRNCHQAKIVSENPLRISPIESITLKAIPMTGISFSWSTGASVPIIEIDYSSAGEITVTAVGEGGACSTQALIEIIVEDFSITSNAINNAYCKEQEIILSVPALNNTIYQWSKDGIPIGANSAVYTISPAAEENQGNYSVVISNAELGINEETPIYSLIYAPLTIDESFEIPDEICVGNEISLDAIFSGGNTPFTISWTVNKILVSSDLNYKVIPEKTTTYGLHVRDAFGCKSDTLFKLINVIPGVTSTNEISQTGFTVNWAGVDPTASYYLDISLSENFNVLTAGYYAGPYSGGVTSTVINTLETGTLYYYRIKDSENRFCTHKSQITKPANPSAKAVQVRTSNSFIASWDEIKGADSYLIDVTLYESNFSTFVNSYNARPVPNSVTEILVTGLLPGTTYRYRVSAQNSAGLSGNSNVIAVSTEGGLPFSVSVTNFNDGVFSGSPIKIQGQINNGVGNIQANLVYVGIADTSSRQKTVPTFGNTFEVDVDSSMLDVLGMEFIVRVVDETGIPFSTELKRIFRSFPSVLSPTIIDQSFEGSRTSIKIISIPYDLNDKNIRTIFAKLGPYDKKTWRLAHYDSDELRNIEYQEQLELIERGSGYWFNAKKDLVNIQSGAGSVGSYHSDNPFRLFLKEGWNQIGNPFPFDVRWDDILQNNPTISGIGDFIVYDGTIQNYRKSNIIPKYEGGFVFAEAQATLDVSVLSYNSSGGRKKGIKEKAELNGDQWFVPLKVSQANSVNELMGFGMHPEASVSKDEWDEIRLPRLDEYLDGAFDHPEDKFRFFTHDILPTSEKASWIFQIESSSSKDPIMLEWDNHNFGNNSANLFLLDLESAQLIDMRKQSFYEFNLATKKEFKVYYNITGEFQPDIVLCGQPYPNPSYESITTNVILPNLQSEYSVSIEVFDFLGRPVKEVHNEFLKPGSHSIQWDGEDNFGSRVSSGVYLVRPKVGSKYLPKVYRVIMK